MNNKSNYPIFINNPWLVLLDAWATAQKHKLVIKKELEFNEKYYWAIWRWNCHLSLRATDFYEKSKETVASFIWAEKDNVAFTSWATESLNLLAYWISHMLNPWDEIILSILEHNSNVLPWQRIKEEKWVIIKFVPLNKNWEISLTNIKSQITDKTKIISLTHVSNVTGQILPIKEVWAITKKKWIYFFVDWCQSAPHIEIDIKSLNVSAYTFSAHKLWWPTWIWALYLDSELIPKIIPFNIWWGIVRKVTQSWYSLLKWIEKLEAWTQIISWAIGFAKACELLKSYGLKNIEKQEKTLLKYWFKKLKEIKWLKIIWSQNTDIRSWIISFYFENIHTHDVACILSEKNICVRAWLHCSDIVHQFLSIWWSTRISLWVYNDKKDIDALIKGLENVVKTFK